MDNRDNMLNLTHTLDKIYLTEILQVQCLQISLHNDTNEMVYYIHTNENDQEAKMYPSICAHHKLNNDNENKIPECGMYMP